MPRFSLTAWVCHAVDVFFADWVCLAAGIFILLLGGLLFSAQTVFDTTKQVLKKVRLLKGGLGVAATGIKSPAS